MKKDGDEMKKISKFSLIIITIFIITNLIVINNSYGAALKNLPGNFYKNKENKSSDVINPDDYKPVDLLEDQGTLNMANKIIGAFQAIGNIVSVLALVIIGVKYMIGSIEEKAEYKKTMINYIIGAILVFAISNISAAIYNFTKNLN